MKYDINGKVVDPIHGAGVITEISDQMISGEICECVVIEIVVGKKRVMVPTESLQEAELRAVVSSEELDAALEELFKEPDELPKDWRRRIEKLKDRVHSGEPAEVAKAIRDIIARSVLNKMNPSEKRVLNEAINVFAGEVALVRNIRSESARELIKRSAQQGVQQNIKSDKNGDKGEEAAGQNENTGSASKSAKASGAGKSRKKSSTKK
ncbi:MAG: CarD family transcriptional regulator [Candidatus Fermentibacteria bacterium]